MRRSIVPLLALALSLTNAATAQTTITVGQGGGYDYATIQSAIDAATTGDTIVVYPGTYWETIHFQGKSIVLRSTDPTSPAIVAATVIEGYYRGGSVVTFRGTETSGCMLAGFTVAGGSATDGGGIQGNGTVARVEYNIICHNSATDDGGGIYDCDGTIQDNTITTNVAEGVGGGLAKCDGTIQNNTISGNNGGGLYGCDGTIQNNAISSNVAWEGGGLRGCRGTIQNNAIFANLASRGGGMAGCPATIQNNTVFNNVAIARYPGTPITGVGGGLYRCDGTIQNNCITSNSAGRRGSGLSSCHGTIWNCIIWRNSAPTGAQLDACSTPSYSCIQDWLGGVGNINEDPQFANPVDCDYHLLAASPCIDAGANGYWRVWPQSDLDSNCRLAGARVDMGCYEYGSTPDSDGDLLADSVELTGGTDPLVADTDGDGLRDGLEVLRGSDPFVVTLPDILRVPLDIPSIQEAVAASMGGDEIVVSPGTYIGNLVLLGTDIVLRSEAPENPPTVAATILDGGAGGSVVSFHGSETEACVLSGFTIQNGSASYGGGIHGQFAMARIQNNAVCNNFSPYWGGGLYGCFGTIQNNVITSNTAGEGGGGVSSCRGAIQNNTISGNIAKDGGGLRKCPGLIEGNKISDNVAIGSGAGAYDCEGTIRNNTITGNSARGGGGLGACHGTIENNIISRNMASDGGGGLNGASGTIQNNRITNNRAESGGGLYGCIGTIQNNTIAFNSATTGGGLFLSHGSIQNCIIWGNSASSGAQLDDSSTPSYSCVQNWPGRVGNISDDPQFADPADGDYHLLAGSPCIYAGANGYWLDWPQRDLDGNCRLSGPRIDMGCYEYGSSPDSDGDLLADGDELTKGTDPLVPDTDGDGLRDGLEVLRGSAPLAPTLPGVFRIPGDIPTIQQALAVSVNGDEIVVTPGMYEGNVRFCGANVILRSEAPVDPATVVTTILDSGGVGGSVVSFQGGESEACILSGFTIQSGRGLYGGGIEGRGTLARIEHNRISGNTARRYGGGLYGCYGTIRNTLISGNTAGRDGGGLKSCYGTIENNDITHNTAGGSGGGLSGCGGTIHNNDITHNTAGGSGGGLSSCDIRQDNVISQNWAGADGGGASYCRGAIERNIISSNTAGSGGGGLHVFRGTIQNSIIANNVAQGSGGGLYWCEGSIVNSTIFGNSAVHSGGGLLYHYGSITNCIISHNSASTGMQLYECRTPSYSCIQDWSGGGGGNISDDPQLVDPPNGDFHLVPTSPCIDAGRRVSLTEDFEGDPRPFDFTNEPRGDGSDFDIGADEALPTMELTTAADPAGAGRVIPAGSTYHYLARTVTVTAIPNCGWSFDHWSGDAMGTTNPTAVVMDTSKTITAHFVAIPGADLEGRLDGVSPSAIVVGGPVSLQGEVSNTGDRASAVAFWVEFWLRNKETGWRGVLCDSIRIGPLGAGESFDLGGIAQPRASYGNIPAGMYAIEMRIDVLGEVAESCETNNVARWEPCVILADRPNLVVTGFDFSPQDVAPEGGTTMTFSGFVENTGSRPTSGSFWIEFRVSRQLPFNPAGPYLCDSLGVTQAIGPGETLNIGPLLRATYVLPPGVYYVGIRLDPLDAIAEQREDDNVTWLTRKKLYIGPRPTDAVRWTLFR